MTYSFETIPQSVTSWANYFSRPLVFLLQYFSFYRKIFLICSYQTALLRMHDCKTLFMALWYYFDKKNTGETQIFKQQLQK